MYPATLEVIAKCQLKNDRKKVVIDTFAAGITFAAGTTYTIDLEQDFVKETEGSKFPNPAVTGLGTFTTNSTGPQIQVDEPTDGGTNVINNTFIRYTYDRQILAGTSGTYKLFKDTASPQTINVTVTASGGYFYVDGVQQATLNLYETNTYVFTYPSAHPFALSTTADGTHGGGTEYTTGVTRNTSANTLTFVVPQSGPDLFYYCTSHSNMGGTANTGIEDSLLRTYDPSDSTDLNLTISGNQITLVTTGLIDANTTYYVLIEEGAVKDRDGLAAFGFDNDQEHRWTTGTIDFPDLTSLKVSSATLSCTITKNPNYEYGESAQQSNFTLQATVIAVTPNNAYLLDATDTFNYVEDTSTTLADVPKISDYIYVNQGGTGTYSLTITPSDTNAVDTMSATNATFNSSTKVLTFSGTLTQINTSLDAVSFEPGVDYDQNFTLNFSVTTPQGNTQAKGLTCNLGSPLDIDLTDMNITRTYATNQANLIFSSNTPYISDFDTDPNAQYTITFNAGMGYISQDTNNVSLTNPISYTSYKSTLNTIISQLKYFPLQDNGNDTTVTVTLTKNSNTIANQTFNLNRTGSIVNNLANSTTTLQNSGTIYPTVENRLYMRMDVTVIGSGGNGGSTSGTGSAGGGGSGGEVVQHTNLSVNLGQYPVSVYSASSSQAYTRILYANNGSNIQVSAGTNGGTSDGSTSTNGANSPNGFSGGAGFWSGSGVSGPAVWGGAAGAGTGGGNASVNAGNYSVGLPGGGLYGYALGGYGGSAATNTPTSTVQTAMGSGGRGQSQPNGGTFIALTNGISGGVVVEYHV